MSLLCFDPKQDFKHVFFFLLRRLVFQFWLCSSLRTLFCATFVCSQEKITSCGASTFSKDFFYVIIPPKSRSQNCFFYLFCSSETSFPIVTLTNISKSLLCMFWLYKRIAPLAQVRKIICRYFAQFEFLKVSFHHFLFFWNLFSKNWFWQFKQLFFVHIFVVSRKIYYLLWRKLVVFGKNKFQKKENGEN